MRMPAPVDHGSAIVAPRLPAALGVSRGCRSCAVGEGCLPSCRRRACRPHGPRVVPPGGRSWRALDLRTCDRALQLSA